jgi:hypothetical protein
MQPAYREKAGFGKLSPDFRYINTSLIEDLPVNTHYRLSDEHMQVIRWAKSPINGKGQCPRESVTILFQMSLLRLCRE